MQRKRNRTTRITPSLGAALFFSLLVIGYLTQASHAGELAYGLGYFGEYSDNIQRVPTDPQSEWSISVFAGIAYRENGPALDAYLQTQAEYRDYRDDVYNDGPLYYADATLLWRAIPRRLNWIFADRYDQVTRTITLPDTPDNRVDSNVLYTGPDMFLRLGPVNTLVFGLRYGDATYGEGDLNNNRYGASVRWQYAASSELTYSLNYEVEQVKFDNEILNDNLRRQDAFLRTDRRQARAQFLFDLGASRIDRDRAGEASGYLARLTWAQQLTSGSSAGVLIGGEYLDSGAALLSTATGPSPIPVALPPSSATGSLTGDLFYTKRAEIFHVYKGDSSGLNAKAFYRDIEYEIVPEDRQEAGGLLDVTYKPTSLLAATLYGTYLKVHYLSFARDDRESETGIRFLYRVNRKLSATLDGRKTWRYSTDASQEYTDRRVRFSLLYSSGPLFTPVWR